MSFGPFLGIYEKLGDRVIGEAYNRPEVAYMRILGFKEKDVQFSDHVTDVSALSMDLPSP